MNKHFNRRDFIKTGTVGLSTFAVQSEKTSKAAEQSRPNVKIGMIGMGGRGYSLLNILLGINNVTVPAVCDINPERNQIAAKLLTDQNHLEPDRYSDDEYAYKKLIEREDLDAVIIATPWNWHTEMAVSAMKCGKVTGVEVPAALSIDECWDLVKTTEKTKIPCMMLENWSFRRDNLAILNMIRKGLFGETVHSQCAYSHDCITYFFDSDGNARWQGKFIENHNRDIYPTHGLGPVLTWMDINCGDRFDSVSSTSSGAFGVNHYARNKFGDAHPLANKKLKQGDIVTTTVKTKKGKTILISNDMLLPRPYDNRWLIQGTQGIYSHEHNAIYLEGFSPQSHTWEEFEPYMKKHEHYLWKNAPADIENRGHGGPDYLLLSEFVKSVQNKSPLPISIYDSVTMSSIVALSEKSIKDNKPIKSPDFTRGKWKTNQPYFALDI